MSRDQMQQRPRNWNEADRDPPCRSQTCSRHGCRDTEDSAIATPKKTMRIWIPIGYGSSEKNLCVNFAFAVVIDDTARHKLPARPATRFGGGTNWPLI
jgi:hypothetical protein